MNLSTLPVAIARIQIASLSNTAQAVFAASGVSGDLGSRYVLGVIFAGGAAAEEVIFRATDDTPEYFRVDVPAATTVISTSRSRSRRWRAWRSSRPTPLAT